MMNSNNIPKIFATSFKYGTGELSASTFSSSIRFLAIMMVIIGMMWCIYYFMSQEEQAQESFLIHLGTRTVRIVIGLCLFILILIVKGNS